MPRGERYPVIAARKGSIEASAERLPEILLAALAAGARTLYPVATIEEAIGLAKTLGRDEVLLAGERKALPIEGFDLGNSPGEFTAEAVGGKTVRGATDAEVGVRRWCGSWPGSRSVVR